MFFALLTNPFPWTANLTPSIDELVEAMNTNASMKFDTLDIFSYSNLKKFFGPILDKCFNVKYLTGSELLTDPKLARRAGCSCSQPRYVLNFSLYLVLTIFLW
jgi:hypothetical protein